MYMYIYVTYNSVYVRTRAYNYVEYARIQKLYLLALYSWPGRWEGPSC